MKRRKPEVGAGLVLRARKNIKTKLVTQMIGLQPTFDSQEPDSLITQHAEWRYDLFPDPTDSAAPVVRKLLTKLGRYRSKILQAQEQFRLSASIELRVNHSGYQPEYSMSPELLVEITKFGAGLDVVVVDMRMEP